MDGENPFADLVPNATAGKAPAAANPFTDLVPKTPAAPTPKTTPSGLAASAARGMAPYAGGAAVGAAIGAPFAGIGAVPGAAAGMGAVGLTELGGSLYNALSPHVGLPRFMTPQATTDRMFDAMGIKRPSTEAEHMTESVAGMLPFGVGSTRGAADLSEAILSNRAGAAEKAVDSLYTRAIKPSTVGRDTVAQRRGAISEIVGNKVELLYPDASGGVSSAGHLPETVEQFDHAIDHAKAKLFGEWDALARASGEAGGGVDTANVVKELRAKAGDPVLLRQDPHAAAYAEELADRYGAAGKILPSEAQRDITGWNQRLKAFYKNPAPEGTGRAGIDEIAARQLRKDLDKTITETAAPGYQELKNRHGALSAIEKDVERASRRIANREPGGGILGRVANVAAAEEVMRGMMTGNWKGVASGAGIKAWAEYMKWRNAPNTAIKKLFETAEKYYKAPHEPGGAAEIIPGAGGPTGNMTAGGTPAERGQSIYGRTGGGEPGISGGSSGPAPALPPRIAPGQQPSAPTGGKPHALYGGASQPGVAGGVVSHSDPIARALGVRPTLPSGDEFTMIPGGGRAGF